MIELTSFTPQLQAAHWGWTIAIFLWLVGLAGMGFFLNYWIRQKNFVYLLTVSGILGTLLVVSHLARMLNLPFGLKLQNCSPFLPLSTLLWVPRLPVPEPVQKL